VQHFRFIHPDHIKITKATSAGLAFKFMLSQFVKTCAWDYYRLNAVVVKCVPQSTAAFPGVAGDNTRIWTVIDYDDDAKPTNRLAFQNEQGVRVHRGDRGFTRKLRPKPIILTQSNTKGQVGSQFQMGKRRGLWLNTADMNIAHYGLKVWFEGPTNMEVQYNLIIKAYFSFMKPIVPPPTNPNNSGCMQMMSMGSYSQQASQELSRTLVSTATTNCNDPFHMHKQEQQQ